MKAGRTGPLLLVCELPGSEIVLEVVAKLSVGCDQGVANLAREVIAACLAGDLGLPIPEPYLIELTPEWTATIADPALRSRVEASAPVAFGSRHITGQYTIWSDASQISESMLPMAAAIFVFDAITQNADRRTENPNCFVRGDELRIFDHEMTFTHGLIIGWRPPWSPGGLKDLETPGFHVFRGQLRRKAIDYTPIRRAWAALSDGRLADYLGAIPAEWAGLGDAVDRALGLIGSARDNIDGCLAEVRRILQ